MYIYIYIHIIYTHIIYTHIHIYIYTCVCLSLSGASAGTLEDVDVHVYMYINSYPKSRRRCLLECGGVRAVSTRACQRASPHTLPAYASIHQNTPAYVSFDPCLPTCKSCSAKAFCVSICTFLLVQQANCVYQPQVPTRFLQRLLRPYLYFSTRNTSKVRGAPAASPASPSP